MIDPTCPVGLWLETPAGIDVMEVYRGFGGGKVDVLTGFDSDQRARFVPLRVALPNDDGCAWHRTLALKVTVLGRTAVHCLDTASGRIFHSAFGQRDREALLSRFEAEMSASPGRPVEDRPTPAVHAASAPCMTVRAFSDLSVLVTTRAGAFMPDVDPPSHMFSEVGGIPVLTLVAPAGSWPPSPDTLLSLLQVAVAAEAGRDGDGVMPELHPTFTESVRTARGADAWS